MAVYNTKYNKKQVEKIFVNIYTVNAHFDRYKKYLLWGCHGFDVVIGISGLRVRELFSVINGQTKLNANDNVVRVDFGAKALAA